MGSIRGLSKGETLATVLVAVLLVAILTPIYLLARGRDLASEDVSAIRHTYVGLAIYQEDNQSAMPGSLADIADLVDQSDLRSQFDPFVGTAKAYPIEPTLPKAPGTVPYRISHAYVGNYIRLGQSPYKRWQDLPPLTGILANIWQGDVQKTGSFTATTSGPVLRIRTDGSLFLLPKRKHPTVMSDFDDLFGTRRSLKP